MVMRYGWRWKLSWRPRHQWWREFGLYHVHVWYDRWNHRKRLWSLRRLWASFHHPIVLILRNTHEWRMSMLITVVGGEWWYHENLLRTCSLLVRWHRLHLQSVNYNVEDRFEERHIISPYNQEHYIFEGSHKRVDKQAYKHYRNAWHAGHPEESALYWRESQGCVVLHDVSSKFFSLVSISSK